ncbi:MAG: hypothetical protein LBS62_07175 [Clostridiales bacterium]|nr:hypothetical protein [Clostridiales bacterium]
MQFRIEKDTAVSGRRRETAEDEGTARRDLIVEGIVKPRSAMRLANHLRRIVRKKGRAK